MRPPPIPLGKPLSVYGKARIDGTTSARRYQIFGMGKEKYQAMRIAVLHPPKTPYLKVKAKNFLEYPERYASSGYWVERPEVES